MGSSLQPDGISKPEPSESAEMMMAAGSHDLDESYDPVVEFEELIAQCGWPTLPNEKEALWRRAMYCRYRCHLINLNEDLV